MITSKKNYLTQWQVVRCSVKLDGVTGILAKSPAATREAEERFEEKSEGGDCATHSPSGPTQQDSEQSCSILDTSVAGNTVQEGCHPWKRLSPQEIRR